MNPAEYAEALDLEELNHDLRKTFVRALDFVMGEASRCEQEHGFGTQTPVEDIALMHSELSEALEEMRSPAGRKINETYYNPEKPTKPEGVPAELADVVIRILGFCERNEIALGDAIVEKMAYNESRPYMHGGKKF